MTEWNQHGISTRRSFLKELAALGAVVAGGACAAPSTLGGAAGTTASADRIGLQLYTVRDLLETDFEGTIERVAQIGYRELEFAGYYNRTPEQVRALLDRLGLTAPSAHIQVPALRTDLAGQIRSAKTIGHRYLTAPVPAVPRDQTGTDAWKQQAAEFNRFGAALRDEGLRFAYHNHSFELAPLSGATTALDILIAETDPALVDFELDLYWSVHGGRDPIQFFQRYPGRFPLWHVKDMRNPQGGKEMTPVGQGSIDFRNIFAHARQSGMRHFFVEHDNAAQTGGSIASIQASYTHLRGILG